MDVDSPDNTFYTVDIVCDKCRTILFRIGDPNGSVSINEDGTENKESFKPFDFSAGVGVGFLSRIGLGVGARYNHGFRNVLDNDGDNNPYLRNSVVNIGLQYHFGAAK